MDNHSKENQETTEARPGVGPGLSPDNIFRPITPQTDSSARSSREFGSPPRTPWHSPIGRGRDIWPSPGSPADPHNFLGPTVLELDSIADLALPEPATAVPGMETSPRRMNRYARQYIANPAVAQEDSSPASFGSPPLQQRVAEARHSGEEQPSVSLDPSTQEAEPPSPGRNWLNIHIALQAHRGNGMSVVVTEDPLSGYMGEFTPGIITILFTLPASARSRAEQYTFHYDVNFPRDDRATTRVPRIPERSNTCRNQ